MGVATKLVAGSLLIIFLVSLIFSVVGVRIIRDRVVAEAQERVRTDLNSAREIYSHQLERIDEQVRFVADRTFVRDGSAATDPVRLVERLTPIQVQGGLDVLTITDRAGIVLLRVANSDVKGDDQSGDPLVARVLSRMESTAATLRLPADELRRESPRLAEQARFAFIPTPRARVRPEQEETSGLVLKAAAPIFGLNHRFIGVVYGAKLLNRSYDIVDKIKQTVFQGLKYEGRDIGTATIFLDDLRISTNVTNQNGSRAVGTRVAEDVYQRVVREGRQWIDRAYVVNRWYITAYEPIRDPAGAAIGILYVGILEQKYVDIQRRTIFVFLGITVAGTLMALTLSYFLSRNITGSINQLVTASRELAHGNLDTRLELRSNDELHDLADTFNFMASALKKRDEKLKEFATRKIMESERLAVVGQLAAGVAHEINNPLQGIVTYSHLLMEKMDRDNPGRPSVEKIVTQANRCRNIIRGLLDFSRPRKPDTRPCSVNGLLHECVSLVGNQAAFQNIEIVQNLREDLPPVVVDPSQIQQVFMNLIINAAEAINGTGRLTLATRYDAAGQQVEVEFTDSGHGIKPEDMERIFDPFFTTKEAGHGTGLGLAISYGIVWENHGTISVESEPGRGATFTVRLPVKTEKTEEGA